MEAIEVFVINDAVKRANRFRVLIVTEGLSGYIPTQICLAGEYADVKKIVDRMNKANGVTTSEAIKIYAESL